MDLNSLLCVGRADMYRYMDDNPSQQFQPVVSSFKMDSLRGSVRKDKPDSRSSSRRSSNSPGSPSKSILRGQILGSNQGSPNGNRNVRFRDGRSHGNADDAFSKLHINETTQTNGSHNVFRTNERVVQVYSASEHDPRAKRNAFSNMVDERFSAPPISSSTPRSARDRSPTNQPGYLGMSNYTVKQRELPKTPIHTIEDRSNKTEFVASGYNPRDSMGIRKDRSPYRSRSSVSKRPASATQTPQVPSGQKIVQNMGVGVHSVSNEYVRSPRGIDVQDGRRIIQNMEFEHRSKEKSIGIQTQDFEYMEFEKSVGIQTQEDEEEEYSKEIGIQTLSDIDTQTPRDVSVQTPRDVEVQTIDDVSLLASDDEDSETHIDAFSQTYSEDEFEYRDAECQTPRDVGIQTPRTVSIQTSDTSDEEEATSVAVQTSDVPDDTRIVPNLDIHTSVWSNTGTAQASYVLSSSDEDSEVSDDEEVHLPPYLTEPFPKKQSVYSYNKPKRSSAEYSRGIGSSVTSSGTLIDHSARQLLERETLSTSRGKEPRVSKSTGSSTCFPPSTSRPFISKKAGSSINTVGHQWQGKHGESMSRIFQAPEETAEAGTQFHSEYHMELQKEEDRIKELSESLEFTPIETHSFDPGSKGKADKQAPRVEPSSAKESLTKNALIKDIDLGPLPRKIDHWLDKHLREQTGVSPSRQNIVKSVDFKDTALDRYSGNPGSDYVFFKKTALGSEYDTFQPKQHQSMMKPYRSVSSPPRTSVTNPRPLSAPPVSRQPYTSKYSHLTPTLSHLRKQAIRKSVTDVTRSAPRTHGSSSNCQRSDTFISSTKPPPQPLTLPLSNVSPSHYPTTPSPDEGTYESLGNQPRFLSNLKDSSNYRPEQKRREYTGTVRQKPVESNKYHLDYWSKRKSKVTEVGNKKGFSTSSKPPIPRGRNPERKKRQASAKSARDTILSNSAEGNKTRSRSADSTPVSRSTRSNGQSRTRDQGTGTGKRYRSVSHDKDPNRVTIGKTPKGNRDSGFIGNDTIQRIIEKSSW